MCRVFMLLAAFVGALRAQPAGAAVAPFETPPIGAITIRLLDPTAVTFKRCFAVLVAPDTVALPMSCLDILYVPIERAPYSWRATFSFSPVDPRTAADDAWVDAGAVEIERFEPPSSRRFAFIDCNLWSAPEACSGARQWCDARFSGAPWRACSADLNYYARALAPGPSHDITLAYLSQPIDHVPVAALASNLGNLTKQHRSVTAVWMDGRAEQTTIQKADRDDLYVEGHAYMRFSAASLAPGPNGEAVLVSLPSHVASLPLDPEVQPNFVQARIDAALPWINATMDHACRTGLRPTCEPPKAVSLAARRADPGSPSDPAPPADPAPPSDPEPPAAPAPPENDPALPDEPARPPQPAPDRDPNKERAPWVPAGPAEPPSRHDVPVAAPANGGCRSSSAVQWALLLVPMRVALGRRRR